MSEQNESNTQLAMRHFIKVRLKILLHQIDNDDIAIGVILLELTQLQNIVNSMIELEKQLDEFNDFLKKNLNENERRKVLDGFNKLGKHLKKVNGLLIKDLGEIDSYLQKKER